MKYISCEEFLRLRFGDKLIPSEFGIEGGLDPNDEAIFVSASRTSSHIMNVVRKSDRKLHDYSTDHWELKNKLPGRNMYI